MVPYDLVRRDENQPRKTFDPMALKELADSIKEQGIVQDLVLEFVPASFKIEAPSLYRDEWLVLEATPNREIPWTEVFKANDESHCLMWAGKEKLADHYRIVCGERRWRASGPEFANLAELPAKVFTGLTAQQRFAMQFVENHQRENVSALEEARAFMGQLAAEQKTQPEFSVEDLAQKLGMGRATGYELRKLTKLCPETEEALVTGKILPSVAGEVAKLPTPAAQKELLKTITNENSWQFPYSVRDVQELIDRNYVKQLKDAPFDTKLTYGNSVAGILNPCTDCPHRSGNMVAEFPDLKSKPHVCTKPDCFAEKSKAAWHATAEAKGLTILTPKEFEKEAGKYLFGNDYCHGANGDWCTPWKKAMGRHAPDPVMVIDGDKLNEYYPKTEGIAAARKNGVKFDAENKATLTPAQKEKLKAKEAAEEKARKDAEAASLHIVKIAATKIENMKWTAKQELEFWRLVFDRMEYNPIENWEDIANRREVKAAKIAGLVDKYGVEGCRSFILECLCADYNGDYADADGYTDDFKALCKFADVDYKAEEKKFLAAQQLALPVAKKKLETPVLVDVKPQPKRGSAANRAALATAAKERWANVRAAK